MQSARSAPRRTAQEAPGSAKKPTQCGHQGMPAVAAPRPAPAVRRPKRKPDREYRRWNGKRVTPALIAKLIPKRPPRPKPAPTGVFAGHRLKRAQLLTRRHQRGLGPVGDVLFRLEIEGVDEFTIAERDDIRRSLIGLLTPAQPGQE